MIKPGDVVNVDVSAELEGYWADTAATLLRRARRSGERAAVCLHPAGAGEGIDAARAGRPMNAIGRAVEDVARRGGYRIIPELPGHGVGRHIHEKPSVYNFYHQRDRTRIEEGMVFTIEPFLSRGSGRIVTESDGWTLTTIDRSICAQYEHTIVISGGKPILATAV